MNNAYVDTTILTNVLLKTGHLKEAAKKALARYRKTELPLYAIKEFKAGPLYNWVYFHNKLAQCGTLSGAMQALHAQNYFKKNLVSTAIEAVSITSKQLPPMGALAKKYGKNADADQFMADQYRLAFKLKIFQAWKKRRDVTSDTVLNLKCYHEAEPTETRGIIEISPTKCDKGGDCCLKAPLVNSTTELIKMADAIKAQPTKAENQRRLKVLNELIRKGHKYTLSDNECRSLGDAVIVFFAPNDAKILTTNEKDFTPLASSLSKMVDVP